MYIWQKSSSPLHFLYGEKWLVRREYLKFDWIFSNIEHEIKHSQCENKCWEILFFCLFGIKVLSINKKERNLTYLSCFIWPVLCLQVGREQQDSLRLQCVVYIWHSMQRLHAVRDHVMISHRSLGIMAAAECHLLLSQSVFYSLFSVFSSTEPFLPFEVGVASSDRCFFNYLFNRPKRKWSWRIKGGARGTGVKYILRGGKEGVMQNWTEQQRSKPPKNLAPSHFSVPLFTLKTLSSNRSYLKKPAACKINPCHVCLDLGGEFWHLQSWMLKQK